MSDCTDYVFLEDDDDSDPCRCPVCKGFLRRDFPTDRPFTCKKCGTELLCFPNKVEDCDEPDLEAGRICPISNRKTKIKSNLGWLVDNKKE